MVDMCPLAVISPLPMGYTTSGSAGPLRDRLRFFFFRSLFSDVSRARLLRRSALLCFSVPAWKINAMQKSYYVLLMVI